MVKVRSLVVGVVLALCVADRAAAAVILDQQNASEDGFLQFFSTTTYQQGVTPGVTGLLTQIDLRFAVPLGNDQARILVFLGAPWQSDAPEFDAVLPILPGWNSFDVSGANIMVTNGAPFSIGIQGVSAPSVNSPSFGTSTGNQYPGNLFVNTALASAVTDANFRTFVDVQAPEPASLFLLGTGALLGLARRRRTGR
jgi:hypothetical protein